MAFKAFNLGDLFDREQPRDQLALIDCANWEGPRRYTHSEFHQLADACARGLVERGLKRGDAVAILASNRAEYLIAYLGTMRAGLVSVPINYKFPKATLEFVLRDSAAKLVFCDRARRGLVPTDVPVIDFDSDGLDGFKTLLNAGPFHTVRPRSRELAMILYTSGSTGRPKGVLLSHEGHLWAVQSRVSAAKKLKNQRLLIAAPLFHMNALASSKFVFGAHASMVLLPEFNARRYIEAIGRFRCTWLTSVPTMLALVVREKEMLSGTDLSSVEIVRMGSAPTLQTLIDNVRTVFNTASISNAYGTTEAGPVMFGPHPDGRSKPELALGWPLPEVEVRLINAKERESNEGVLWIRTPANMLGYRNLPEKTREVLTEDGWYISGDILRRDTNGLYYFVGRADDMFVCGGENIYPGEVEAMLERHPDIVQACVVPVVDEIKGAKPFAFIVARPSSGLTENDVKSYALANAPSYQHPRRVVFVDALPLAGTNKIDRQALNQRAGVIGLGA